MLDAAKEGKEWKHRSDLDKDFKTCFITWLTDGSCWTIDCSRVDDGPQLLHIMRQGLAFLPAAK